MPMRGMIFTGAMPMLEMIFTGEAPAQWHGKFTKLWIGILSESLLCVAERWGPETRGPDLYSALDFDDVF